MSDDELDETLDGATCFARHPVFGLLCHRLHPHVAGEHGAWEWRGKIHTLHIWGDDDNASPPPFGTTAPMPARRAPREIEA